MNGRQRTQSGETQHGQPLWQNWLVRELVVVLLFKMALIFGLWFAFFRLPDEPGIDHSTVAGHVLGDQSRSVTK